MAGRAPCILVVDDNPDICELLQAALERSGYDVITATSGEQALLGAKNPAPDLAVIDLLMPGIGGLAIAAQLAAKGMAVLLISGASDRLDLLRDSGYPFLLKPFHLSELLTSIDQLLARQPRLDLSAR